MHARPAYTVLFVLLAVGLAVAAAPPTAGTHDEPEPPSTGDCERRTDGRILTSGVPGTTPACVVVDPGEPVTWTNADPLLLRHDPGDGTLDQPWEDCWRADTWTAGRDLAFGQSFTAEFQLERSAFFGEETLTLRNISVDGEVEQAYRPCNPDDDVWTRNEDGDVAIRYKCYVHSHNRSGAGWIVLDTA